MEEKNKIRVITMLDLAFLIKGLITILALVMHIVCEFKLGKSLNYMSDQLAYVFIVYLVLSIVFYIIAKTVSDNYLKNPLKGIKYKSNYFDIYIFSLYAIVFGILIYELYNIDSSIIMNLVKLYRTILVSFSILDASVIGNFFAEIKDGVNKYKKELKIGKVVKESRRNLNNIEQEGVVLSILSITLLMLFVYLKTNMKNGYSYWISKAVGCSVIVLVPIFILCFLIGRIDYELIAISSELKVLDSVLEINRFDKLAKVFNVLEIIMLVLLGLSLFVIEKDVSRTTAYIIMFLVFQFLYELCKYISEIKRKMDLIHGLSNLNIE